ncbi:MAG TPA: Hsp20/alpha crystallin family protein [Ferrovibrio sp.]|uniref:Hsp20/alpha crystallin family protein n=1 Tax=Ferrovibrio sp. TaxID=1917215 RepID=UPI002B4ACD7B|nr:Hsp20/alpha crystallin family protein [Ferrovibrio sp.]HLT76399.1 Hsp20/alpha crystallin family protein [Ferrovibrio sp.]
MNVRDLIPRDLFSRDLLPRDLLPWGRRQGRPVPYRGDREPAWAAEYSPFLALHREVNRLFDDVFRSFDGGAFAPLASWSGGWPHVEISDSEREIRICAELPGMEEKDVELRLEDDMLVLRGEKRAERQEDDGRHFSERFYGRFERRIPLPAEIDEEKVSASFRNGVLDITLPKTARAVARSRRIAINGRH